MVKWEEEGKLNWQHGSTKIWGRNRISFLEAKEGQKTLKADMEAEIRRKMK